jgi:hypothetical protein
MKSSSAIIVFAVFVAGLLSGCMLPPLLYARVMQEHRAGLRGPAQIFVIEPTPASLTEELAFAKATETLAREGYKSQDWRPSCEYQDEARATIRFTGKGRYRVYLVRLSSGTVICHSAYGTQRDFDSWETRPKPDSRYRHGKGKAR